jgi:hypothetical protein
VNSATRWARYRIAFRRQRQHRLERSEKSVTVHREMADAPTSAEIWCRSRSAFALTKLGQRQLRVRQSKRPEHPRSIRLYTTAFYKSRPWTCGR